MNHRTTIALVAGIVAALIVVGVAATYYLYPNLFMSSDGVVARTPDAPARLMVPSLGIDAPIEPVGRTPEGNMGSPTSFTGIAWFKEGVIPGQKGSAVVAGHLDNALGRAGVFKNLEALRLGDEIVVETASGELLRFKVIRMAVYPYDAPPEGLFTRSDGVYLNLITCTGEWLQEAKTYDGRLVVYTELVP
jgi:LPXTG-site transpeptidase (sortase) family protein